MTRSVVPLFTEPMKRRRSPHHPTLNVLEFNQGPGHIESEVILGRAKKAKGHQKQRLKTLHQSMVNHKPQHYSNERVFLLFNN